VKKQLFPAIVILMIILAGLAVRHFLFPPAQLSNIGTATFFAANFVDQQGQAQPMTQWKGKTLVVNFWATWCSPCLEEMPELSELQQEYADSQLVVLGISSDELDKIREFSQQNPVSYPLFAGDIDAMSISESLGNSRGVLPYTVVIDAQGDITNTYFGRVNKAMLETALQPLLSDRL
jgi:thiol-disulfide isomerase/thioredoxin